MSKDPYTILGINKNASPEEIKKAYRKLAHQHHPDKKGGNEVKFKEINEAYQTLSDPDKKTRYDTYGHAGAQNGFGGASGYGGSTSGWDFGDLGGYESIFDMFSGSGYGATSPRRSTKGEDLHLQVKISKKDLGKKKTYEFEAFNKCIDCSGTGAEGGKLEECKTCNGQGKVRQSVQTPFGVFAQVVACQKCDGDGMVAHTKCHSCNGAGRRKVVRKLELHIPDDIKNRHLVAFPQEGNAGSQGTPSGDLLITIHLV